MTAALIRGALYAAPPASAATATMPPSNPYTDLPAVYPVPNSITAQGHSVTLGSSVAVVATDDTNASAVTALGAVPKSGGVGDVYQVADAAAVGLRDSAVYLGSSTANPATLQALQTLGVPDASDFAADGYALATGKVNGRAMIVLNRQDVAGTFYAVQTMRLLITTQGNHPVVPGVTVRTFSSPLDDLSYTTWNCAADKTKFGTGDGAAGQAQAYLLTQVQKDFIDMHPGHPESKWCPPSIRASPSPRTRPRSRTICRQGCRARPVWHHRQPDDPTRSLEDRPVQRGRLFLERRRIRPAGILAGEFDRAGGRQCAGARRACRADRVGGPRPYRDLRERSRYACSFLARYSTGGFSSLVDRRLFVATRRAEAPLAGPDCGRCAELARCGMRLVGGFGGGAAGASCS
ncbi:glycoside hydrolase family 20 zincin-like fold domain-containing protein [Rathayibacter soli]|nr:glycoside hydrolase family 20 zincin-like fold domain-containing protein [Glaciibacter superstes]